MGVDVVQKGGWKERELDTEEEGEGREEDGVSEESLAT